ncbi:hypothetical protein BSPWISOXPB_6864 [uncultured Gammaproteobacteria bacterium]|nr:hypothetical protein BSPWISOXPB_6864 [uncultured Gammaproteobacteria bacterium]
MTKFKNFFDTQITKETVTIIGETAETFSFT